MYCTVLYCAVVLYCSAVLTVQDHGQVALTPQVWVPRHFLRPKRHLALAWRRRRQAMGTSCNWERPIAGNAIALTFRKHRGAGWGLGGRRPIYSGGCGGAGPPSSAVLCVAFFSFALRKQQIHIRNHEKQHPNFFSFVSRNAQLRIRNHPAFFSFALRKQKSRIRNHGDRHPDFFSFASRTAQFHIRNLETMKMNTRILQFCFEKRTTSHSKPSRVLPLCFEKPKQSHSKP